MIGYLVLGVVLYAIVWIRVAIEIVDVARRRVTTPWIAVQGLALALVPPVAIVMAATLISLGWRPWRLWASGWERSPPERSS